MKCNGFITKCLYSCPWLEPGFGFGRGFDSYDKIKNVIDGATKVTDRAIKIINTKSHKEPLFLGMRLHRQSQYSNAHMCHLLQQSIHHHI